MLGRTWSQILNNKEVKIAYLSRGHNQTIIYLPRHFIRRITRLREFSHLPEIELMFAFMEETPQNLELLYCLYKFWKEQINISNLLLDMKLYSRTKPHEFIKDRSIAMGLHDISRAYQFHEQIYEHAFSFPPFEALKNILPDELIREIAVFILDDIKLHRACCRLFDETNNTPIIIDQLWIKRLNFLIPSVWSVQEYSR